MTGSTREELFASDVPGFKVIFGVKSHVSKRIVWIGLLITAVVLGTLQICDRVLYFYRRPVTVKRADIHQDRIPFPRVTICNHNPIKRMKENASGGTPEDNSFTLHDLVLECTWLESKCADEDFVRSYTETGLCLTFNGNVSREILHVQTFTSDRYGLNLLLNTHLETYDNVVENERVGFVISLSPHEFMHNTHVRAIDAPAGLGTSLALRRDVEFNLKPPYGKCGEENLEFFNSYSEVNCRRECWNRYVMSKCGCYELDLHPYVDQETFGYRLCSPEQMESCEVHHKFQEYLAEGRPCEHSCPRDCVITSHDLFRSPTYFTMAQSKIDELTKLFGENVSYWQKNVVGVSVYLGSMKERITTHQVGYTALALFCDIGGAFSLLLGIGIYQVLGVTDMLAVKFLNGNRALKVN